MRVQPDQTVLVWDRLLRACHWLLVAGVAVGWYTRQGFGADHERIGYVVLAVVVIRLAWGFGPSRHARFSEFIHPPAVVVAYARSLRAGTQRRYLGHNPLGGWMSLALLLMVLTVCLSGWLYTTDRFWGVAWVEALHAWSTNLLLAAVGLHLSGVLFSSWHGHENLVAAMWHGRKRAPNGRDVA